MNNRPLFSILHPSNRPDAWHKVFKVYDAWMSACVDPSLVECSQARLHLPRRDQRRL